MNFNVQSFLALTRINIFLCKIEFCTNGKKLKFMLLLYFFDNSKSLLVKVSDLMYSENEEFWST